MNGIGLIAFNAVAGLLNLAVAVFLPYHWMTPINAVLAVLCLGIAVALSIASFKEN